MTWTATWVGFRHSVQRWRRVLAIAIECRRIFWSSRDEACSRNAAVVWANEGLFALCHVSLITVFSSWYRLICTSLKSNLEKNESLIFYGFYFDQMHKHSGVTVLAMSALPRSWKCTPSKPCMSCMTLQMQRRYLQFTFRDCLWPIRSWI